MFRAFLILLGTLGMDISPELQDAFLDGNLEEAQSLLANDLNRQLLGRQLYLAYFVDNLAMVTSLIDSGHLPLDARDRDGAGLTALHHAANAADLSLVNFLLNQGASVDAKTKLGIDVTPLSVATLYGNLETVKLLVTKWGANPEAAALPDPHSFPESKASLEWLQAFAQQRKEVVRVIQEVLRTAVPSQGGAVAATDVGRLIAQFSHGWIPSDGFLMKLPRKSQFDPNSK